MMTQREREHRTWKRKASKGKRGKFNDMQHNKGRKIEFNNWIRQGWRELLQCAWVCAALLAVSECLCVSLCMVLVLCMCLCLCIWLTECERALLCSGWIWEITARGGVPESLLVWCGVEGRGEEDEMGGWVVLGRTAKKIKREGRSDWRGERKEDSIKKGGGGKQQKYLPINLQITRCYGYPISCF